MKQRTIASRKLLLSVAHSGSVALEVKIIIKSMKINIQICALLLLFNLITSCNGQDKTDVQKDSVSEQETIVGGQAKIIRTQGIVSGNLHCNLQDKAGNIDYNVR